MGGEEGERGREGRERGREEGKGRWVGGRARERERECQEGPDDQLINPSAYAPQQPALTSASWSM